MYSHGQQLKNVQVLNQWNHEGIMYVFVVIIVPADGLAPLGAWPSADTVMTKLQAPQLYMIDYTN